ncbi:MAG: DNA-processing protein DprA [Nocardioidaceae bacterium]
MDHAPRLLDRSEAGYPGELRSLPDPPAAVWVRGRLGAGPRLAVVGTRTPTAWGRRTAGLVATEAARRGICVVSGLALGIDIAAHRACLRAGGETIAVLGGGVDLPTPRAHVVDAERILAHGGALLSEQPPGTRPNRGTLTARDRLQAALARATVVVQSDLASGTMHTARFTAALHHPLVVAAPPAREWDDAASSGNRALLSGSADHDLPHATFVLRSADDLDAVFALLAG